MENSVLAAVVAAPPKQLKVPPAAQATIDAWCGFKTAADEYWARFLQLRAAERAALGLSGESESYRLVMYEYEARVDVEKIATRALNSLVWAAEREFAPPGASLSIAPPDKDDVPGADLENFDPSSVWEYLSRTYGGDAGAQSAYRQAAVALGRALNITVGMEPRMVGGRSVFEHSVYPDKIFGDVLRLDDARSLNCVLNGLLAVGEWSGLWCNQEKQDVNWVRHAITRAERSKVLPSRMSIGSAAAVIPFKSKWEFRIAPDFAEKMQLFLTEFGGFRGAHY